MAINIDWNLAGKPNALTQFARGQDEARENEMMQLQQRRVASQDARQQRVDARQDVLAQREDVEYGRAQEDTARKREAETLITLDRLTAHIETPEQLEAAKTDPQIRSILPRDFDLAAVDMSRLAQLRQAARALRERKLTEVTAGASLYDPERNESVYTAPAREDPLEEERRSLITAQTEAARAQVPLREAQATRALRPPQGRAAAAPKLPTGFILD